MEVRRLASSRHGGLPPSRKTRYSLDWSLDGIQSLSGKPAINSLLLSMLWSEVYFHGHPVSSLVTVQAVIFSFYNSMLQSVCHYTGCSISLWSLIWYIFWCGAYLTRDLQHPLYISRYSGVHTGLMTRLQATGQSKSEPATNRFFFPKRQVLLWGSYNSLLNGRRGPLRGVRDVKVKSYLYVMSELRMSEAVFSLTCTPAWHVQSNKI